MGMDADFDAENAANVSMPTGKWRQERGQWSIVIRGQQQTHWMD